MTEPEDYLGFNDPTERRADAGPAFYAPARTGGHELRTMSLIAVDAARETYIGRIHRWETSGRDGRQMHHDTSRTIFTTATDPRTFEPCDEHWDTGKNPETGQERDEGERWRQIMSWPPGIVPTPDDARAFLLHGYARLKAKWWPELQAARVRDEAAAQGLDEAG